MLLIERMVKVEFSPVSNFRKLYIKVVLWRAFLENVEACLLGVKH